MPRLTSLSRSVAGLVALVTGAASGMGRATAFLLADEGAKVAVTDVVDPAPVVEAITKAGGEAIGRVLDVSDGAAITGVVSSVAAYFGGIDILINNAGKHLMKYNQPFSVLERDELRALFGVNVIGVVNCSVSARPSMAARGGGVIVNISSMASYLSSTPYAVSKLAVRGLTIAFAGEFATDHIRVNAIAPGLMATENAIADLPQQIVAEIVDQQQLIHRLGTMDDIVQAMLYLCSDESSFVTGETLRVTGGTPLFL
jgi:3-oxoacyl-[acyl-carrier protein] reductase